MIRRGVRRLFHLGLRRDEETAHDVSEEIAGHLAERAARLERQGLSAAAARAEALRRFGPLADGEQRMLQTARARDRRLRWRDHLDGLVQDARHARRWVAAEPGLAAVVVLLVALGVAASTAMFGVLDRLLLRGPQHVREPRSVARIYVSAAVPGRGEFTGDTFGYVTYTTLRATPGAFAGVAAYSYSPESTRTLGSGEQAEQVLTADATWDLFPLLGTRPALGHFFGAEEDRPGAAQPVVVLGNTLWRQRYAADPAVLGRTVQLDGLPHTVIGVAPAGFTGAELGRVDAWLPMSLRGAAMSDDWQTTPSWQWLRVVVRLTPGVSAEQAAARATPPFNALFAGNDEVLAGGRLSARPLWYDDGGREAMEVALARWLLALAAVVLLVACANVGNLLLARAIRERRALAVRMALGISGHRLVRLLLAQGLLLASLGGLAAVALLPFASALLRRWLLPHVDWSAGAIDGRTLLVALTLTVATGVLATLAPATAFRGTNVLAALRTGVREGAGRSSRLRTALTVAQAALSVLLLVGAGLFLRSLWQARTVDLGLEPERVLAVAASWPRATGEDLEARLRRRDAFYVRALAQVQRLPAVESAAIAVGTPFGSSFTVSLRVPGWEELPQLPGGGPYVQAVSPGYLATVGLRLLQGRDFGAADRAGSEPVALVSRTMAETLWPRGEVLGNCLHVGEAADAPCTRVVGVVEDAHRFSLAEPAAMHYYLPFGHQQGFGGSQLLVRPRGEPAALVQPLRAALAAGEPALLWLYVDPLADGLAAELRPRRLGAVLVGSFGGLALLIAALGLYSLVAHTVASRVHELAMRMVLGARRSEVMTLVLRSGLGPAVAGLAVGCGVALAIAPRLSGLLFQTSPRDPLVYGAVAATLLAAAALACLLPANRATRVPPAAALRED